MNIYIALLRGINVTGHNKIKMADLKESLLKSGLNNVITYIQSGNIVFQSSGSTTNKLEELIINTVQSDYGHTIQVVVLTNLHLNAIFNENPFLAYSGYDFTKMHVTLLKNSLTKEEISTMEALKSSSEELIISNNIAYLYCPNGYGKTKLSNTAFERKCRTSATTRNWRTMTKLVELSTL